MGETGFLHPGHALRPPKGENGPSATAACSNRLEITGFEGAGVGEGVGRTDVVEALGLNAGELGDLWMTIRSFGAHYKGKVSTNSKTIGIEHASG
jgi:hypothetical protein